MKTWFSSLKNRKKRTHNLEKKGFQLKYGCDALTRLLTVKPWVKEPVFKILLKNSYFLSAIGFGDFW